MNTVLLLQIAIIILVSMMLQKFSLSLGAPYLLALLTLGLLFGNYGIISLGYIGYPFAQRSCEVALIFPPGRGSSGNTGITELKHI